MRSKQLEQTLRKKRPVNIDEAQVSRTIALAKNEIANNRRFERIGFLSFCLRQAGFFGWKTWFVQAVVLAVLCIVFDVVNLRGIGALSYSTAFMVRASAIITVLTVLPMLYRSSKYRMLEVEISTRGGYLRLLFSRLALVGIGDILMLAGIFAFAVLKTDLGLFSALFCLLVPFLAMLSVLLLLLPRIPLRALPYALYASSTVMLIGAAWLGSKAPSHAMYPIWGAVCILFMVFCTTQLVMLWRQGGFSDVQFS